MHCVMQLSVYFQFPFLSHLCKPVKDMLTNTNGATIVLKIIYKYFSITNLYKVDGGLSIKLIYIYEYIIRRTFLFHIRFGLGIGTKMNMSLFGLRQTITTLVSLFQSKLKVIRFQPVR